MLLPRIVAVGALDEAPLALAGALDLPPAVEPFARLAALARAGAGAAAGGGRRRAADRGAGASRANSLLLMDEAERAELDLPAALENAADADYAEHWQVTLRFLDIVTRAWPAWLAERGLMNPAARQAALLRAQAEAWAEAPPAEPVWVAGTTGAACRRSPPCCAAIACLPQGLRGAARPRLGDGGGGLGGAGRAASAGGAARPAGRSRRRPAATWPPGTARARCPRAGRAPWPRRCSRRGGSARGGRRWSPDTRGLFRLDAADQQEEAVGDRADPARCVGNARPRARRWSRLTARSPAGWQRSCCAGAWLPTTARARNWPRRRRRPSCACWRGRWRRRSRQCRCWRC